jgi:hypothetical protein
MRTDEFVNNTCLAAKLLYSLAIKSKSNIKHDELASLAATCCKQTA